MMEGLEDGGIPFQLKCVVCCTTKNEDFDRLKKEGDELEGVENNEYMKGRLTFQNFCGDLLSLKNLTLEEDFTLCSKCTLQVGAALGLNLKVDSIECRVRSLQLSILQALRELQGSLEAFDKQFKEIEGAVRGSEKDSFVLECSERNGRNGDVFLFRSQILNVTKDLKAFRSELRMRFPGNDFALPDPVAIVKEENIEPEETSGIFNLSNWLDDFHPTGESINHPPMPPTKAKSRSKRKVKYEDFNEEEVHFNIKSSKRKGLQRQSGLKSRSEILRDPLEDEDGFTPPRYDSDPDFEVEDEKKPRTPKKRRRRKFGDDEGEDDVDYDPRNDPPEFINQFSLNFQEGDEEIEIPEGDQEGLSLSTGRKFFRIEVPNPMSKISLDGLSPFKKFAVISLLEQKLHIPVYEEEGVDPTSPEFLFKKIHQEINQFYFDFEPYPPISNEGDASGSRDIDGKIHLQGVEVKINEPEQSIDCTQCRYKFKLIFKPKKKNYIGVQKAKQKIKFHILKRHMKNIQCPICIANFPSHPVTLYDPHAFKLHLLAHMNQHPNTCKICGKPLNFGGSTLRTHEWTHKSEEERREAEERGEVNPLKVKVKVSSSNVTCSPEGIPQRELKFQCATCGKGFSLPSQLRLHEEKHKDPKDRVRKVCDRCSKPVLVENFKKHYDHHCPALECTVTCPYPQCGAERKFRSNKALRAHIRSEHCDVTGSGLPRPFICELCGKDFKTSAALKVHRETHRTDTPFVCELCGKGWALKKNYKRHKCMKKANDNSTTFA